MGDVLAAFGNGILGLCTVTGAIASYQVPYGMGNGGSLRRQLPWAVAWLMPAASLVTSISFGPRNVPCVLFNCAACVVFAVAFARFLAMDEVTNG